jgi:methylenetetrahydrofolate dehydrogenase (NADP+)/methenyltetrahydrofolate cyclohydrolase
LSFIDPKKDVDNLRSGTLVESPTVTVVKEVLQSVGWKLADKKVAVVGRGRLVGGPIIKWLEKEGVDFKVADEKTENLQEFLSDADLIISGVGKEGLIKPEWLKDGAGVIDFGFPADFDFSSLEIRNLKLKIEPAGLAFYTPTPGGTGPILVAKLFENFYLLNNIDDKKV